MFKNIFKQKKDMEKVIEKELRDNISILKSLKEYDEGKKDISTTEIKRRLPNIRVAD